MQTVIIVIHLLIVIALVGVVLIQRSEGGGLGIGGGSGFMSARGTRNTLTRATAILATAFFITSLVLVGLQALPDKSGSDIFDLLNETTTTGQKVAPAAEDDAGEHITTPLPAEEATAPAPAGQTK
ncbi:MAG: Protein translocase subunit secG [Candidatus Tokpelaia hoelldobleri]|uniref:Protein-export membrane protein SecG n=1 Tax=Candidatus Tokpelaia hoelldobleri TaxID=1902579 RepID=A0A1U9JU35_9HYPH|nr:MAG: Protein translocase subunit secG [Candidatus Tokpelaia hoelldoblerii]